MEKQRKMSLDDGQTKDSEWKITELQKEIKDLLIMIERKHEREQDKIEKRFNQAVKVFVIHVQEELQILMKIKKNNIEANKQNKNFTKAQNLEKLNNEYVKTLKENKKLADQIAKANIIINELKVRNEIDEKIRDHQAKRISELERFEKQSLTTINQNHDKTLEEISTINDEFDEFQDEISKRINIILKEKAPLREKTHMIMSIVNTFTESLNEAEKMKKFHDRKFKSLQDKYCSLLTKQSNLFSSIKQPSELAGIFSKCVESVEERNSKSLVSDSHEYIGDDEYSKILKEFLIQKPIQSLLKNFITGKTCCSHEDCLNNLARKNLFIQSNLRTKSQVEKISGFHSKLAIDILNSARESNNYRNSIINGGAQKDNSKSVPNNVPKRIRSFSASTKGITRINNKFNEVKKLIDGMQDQNNLERSKDVIPPLIHPQIEFTYDGIKVPIKDNTFQRFFFRNNKEPYFHKFS